MTTTYTPEQLDAVRAYVQSCAGRVVLGVDPWPGAPIGHFKIDETPTLDAMVRDGHLSYVRRPRATNPTRTATFVVLAQ